MLHYRIKKLNKNRDFFLRNLELLKINPKKLVLPDFLIIGAPKAGSTWLHNNLKKHPNIFFPYMDDNLHDPSEVRYFTTRFNYSFKWYSELYKDHHDKIKGDKTPRYYLLSKSRIKLIKQLLPEVKIIFIIREPVERSWSEACMNLIHFHQKNFNENKKEYQAFLQSRIERGMYSNYINNWKEFFSDDQFKIFLFDDIKKDPLELITRIAKYIGIESDHSIFSDINLKNKINKNPGEEMPEEIKLMFKDTYKKEIIHLNEEHNLDVLHWLEE